MRYAIVIERSETGYGAYAPDLPGVGVTGDSIEEVKRLIREAINFHIEGLQEDGLPAPKPTSITDYIETAA